MMMKMVMIIWYEDRDEDKHNCNYLIIIIALSYGYGETQSLFVLRRSNQPPCKHMAHCFRLGSLQFSWFLFITERLKWNIKNKDLFNTKIHFLPVWEGKGWIVRCARIWGALFFLVPLKHSMIWGFVQADGVFVHRSRVNLIIDVFYQTLLFTARFKLRRECVQNKDIVFFLNLDGNILRNITFGQ